MTHRIALPAILAVIGAPAIAEITADDVWANGTMLMDAFGISIEAEITREGNAVFYDNVEFSYLFPMNFGTLQVATPPMTMVEKEDGTVVIVMPKTMDYRLIVNFGLTTGISFTGDIRVQSDDLKTSVSGTPSQITYAQIGGPTITTGSYYLVTNELAEPASNRFESHSEGFELEATISAGQTISLRSAMTLLPSIMHIDDSDVDGFRTINEDHYGHQEFQLTMAIPTRELDILNLAPALHAGMFIKLEAQAGTTLLQETNYLHDDLMTETTAKIGAMNGTFELSQQGLAVALSEHDGQHQSTIHMLQHASFTGLLDALEVHIEVPIIASTTPQPARLKFRGDNINFGDDVWQMIDPTTMLPHDPMNFDVDISARASSMIEWLDFMNIENELMIQQFPFELHDLQVDAFDISGAGAALSATGAFTFDMSDLDTFDGMPRPMGAAGMTVTGAHALLDNLITLGLLDANEVSGMRMGLGMFTRDDGTGVLSTSVEIDDTGSVHVNGERVR
jgi:hypothetical protein